MEASAAEQYCALPRRCPPPATRTQPDHGPDDAVADALLAAAGQRDLCAFGAFHDQTAPTVFGLLYGVLGDPAPAALATERVYLQLWRSAPWFEAAHGPTRSVLLHAARRKLTHCLCPIGTATAVFDRGTSPAPPKRR